jgi:hypothetical protein
MNERKLTKSELAKREDIIMKMKDNKRALVQKYGKDAEAVMYGRATNLAKKEAKNMDQDKIKELVKDALQNPKKADLNKDGKLSDYEKKRGAAIEKATVKELDLDLKGGTEKDKDADIAGVVGAESALGLEEDLNEDLDLGHEDNEPHMLKGDLYRIGKYAMELYQMVDKFEGKGEVDFPHWWQSKIIKSKDMLVSAKHYLDFEVNEPQIDAMVDVASEEDVIDENAIGINDRRLDDKQKSALDLAVRGDSAYTFGNDPYADDQLRYKYAVKMGFLEETKAIKEGVWSLGSINDIKAAIQTMEMGLDMDDTELEKHLQDNDAYFYNVLGDDELHDPLSRAYDQAAMGNEDRAHNELSDAIGRAYDLLKMQMGKEQDLTNENIDQLELPSTTATKANTAITTAPTMAKVLLKMYNQLQSKEQTDFSKNGDLRIVLQKLEKLASQVKEGLPKGYWDKKMDAKDEVSEDYDALVNKIKKQGKSEKAAKAIAGAVASYKAKGGGKGPTAKQKG